MELPYTKLTTSDVGNILGTSIRTVKGLCTHPNINVCSFRKPFAHASNSVDINDFNAMRGINHGFRYTTISSAPALGAELPEIYYQPPIGGSAEPFRLGDFRGYKHDTPPSIAMNIQHNYTSTVSSSFTLTVTQKDADLSLSGVVGRTSPFRLALIQKNANRVRIKTFPVLVGLMEPHLTYSITMQGMIADEGLLTDFYVVMVTKDYPDEDDTTWNGIGTMIGLNFRHYKEYHKQYTIIGLPKEEINYNDFELRKRLHNGRNWICVPVVYLGTTTVNKTVTFKGDEHYIKFYSQYKFRDNAGKTFNEIIVPFPEDVTYSNSIDIQLTPVLFPFDEVDSSLFPKAPIDMYLYRKGKDGSKEKIVYQRIIDFHDIR